VVPLDQCSINTRRVSVSFLPNSSSTRRNLILLIVETVQCRSTSRHCSHYRELNDDDDIWIKG